MWRGVQVWRVVIAFVLSAFGIFLILFFSFSINYLKERRLVSELKNMRVAILLYSQEKRGTPESLNEAAHLSSGSQGAKGQQSLLLDFRSLRRDKDGIYLDPFGNPYAYDPVSGWVSSSTPGYEEW